MEGVTYEWSPAENVEAVKMCLDLGIDPNAADDQGRTALHGAAHKGRTRSHPDAGRSTAPNSMRTTTAAAIPSTARCWARPGFRSITREVWFASACSPPFRIPTPKRLLAKLMKAKGLEVPPNFGSSICLTTLCGDTSEKNEKPQ